MLTLANLIAAGIGAALVMLGFWGSAIADRLRYPRLQADLAALRTMPIPEVEPARPRPTRWQNVPPPRVMPPRKPQRRAPAPQRSEVEAWLAELGVAPELARSAAQAAIRDIPSGTTEDQIRAAMRYLPQEN